MPAFVLVHLRNPQLNEDVFTYMERVQSTLEPFGGRFRVHVPNVEVIEGDWPGTVVILEFPDRDAARAWYDSPAYQDILPLRTRNIDGAAIIVDGVGSDYNQPGRPRRCAPGPLAEPDGQLQGVGSGTASRQRTGSMCPPGRPKIALYPPGRRTDRTTSGMWWPRAPARALHP